MADCHPGIVGSNMQNTPCRVAGEVQLSAKDLLGLMSK